MIGPAWLPGACVLDSEPVPVPTGSADAVARGRERPVKSRVACTPPNGWQLAPALEFEREVDYVADFDFDGNLVSEAGEGCAGADAADLCLAALDSARAMARSSALPRQLLTTEGDQVRLWPDFAARTLFGEIDSIEEAIWVAFASTMDVPCDADLARTEGGFAIDGVMEAPICGMGRSPSSRRIVILKDGSVSESALFRNPLGAPCPPRR